MMTSFQMENAVDGLGAIDAAANGEKSFCGIDDDAAVAEVTYGFLYCRTDTCIDGILHIG